MEILRKNLLGDGERGCLDGQLLLAMPGLDDSNFSRTVIYVCAHTGDGAIGFILNRPKSLSFGELMVQLELIDSDDLDGLSGQAQEMQVQCGGPVDQGRGFVLHSDDYQSESTLPISEDVCLTATVDVLRAITRGKGPRQAIMMLGYSGWGAGQLENEVSANGWLTCPASREIIFNDDFDAKYHSAFASMGIDPAMLSSDCGQA